MNHAGQVPDADPQGRLSVARDDARDGGSTRGSYLVKDNHSTRTHNSQYIQPTAADPNLVPQFTPTQVHSPAPLGGDFSLVGDSQVGRIPSAYSNVNPNAHAGHNEQAQNVNGDVGGGGGPIGAEEPGNPAEVTGNEPVQYIAHDGQPTLQERVSDNFVLVICIGLGWAFWLMVLISQAYVTSLFERPADVFSPIRTGWFGFAMQFLLLLFASFLLFSRPYHHIPPYHIQMGAFAALVVVFGVISADANIYATLPAQSALAAGWLLTVIIDIILLIFFTSPPGSYVEEIFHPGSAMHHAPMDEKAGNLEGGRPASRYASGIPDAPMQLRPISTVMSARQSTATAGDISLSHLGLGAHRAPGVPDSAGVAGVGAAGKTALGASTGATPRSPLSSAASGSTEGAQRRSGWSFLARGGGGAGPNTSTPKIQQAVQLPMGGAQAAPPAGDSSVMQSRSGVGEALGITPPDSEHPTAVAEPAAPTQQATTTRKASKGKGVPRDQRTYPRAEAIFTYKAGQEDPGELSFKKGDILQILDSTGKWWEARRADGTSGIVPSNYLRML